MPAIAQLPHAGWGLRDIDGVIDKDRFLPCVSCLHPMLTMALMAGNAAVSERRPSGDASAGTSAIEPIARARGWNILLNDCSDSEMSRLAAQRASHHELVPWRLLGLVVRTSGCYRGIFVEI